MQRHVAFVKVQLSRVRLRTELEKEKRQPLQGVYYAYTTKGFASFLHYNEVFNLINTKTA